MTEINTVMSLKKINVAVLIIVVLITILSTAMAMVLYDRTLVEWWHIAFICFLPAIPTGFALRKVFTGVFGWSSQAAGTVISTVMLFLIFSGIYYSANYYGSDSQSRRDLPLEVTDKFSEEHYRTKRVSRSRYTRGEKYMVYKLEILLPDGRHKIIDIPFNTYKNVRVGKTINLSVEDGLLGSPVIKNIGFPIRKYRPAK